MMKRFHKRYLLVLIITFFGLVYFFYIRDWIKPVSFDVTIMKAITYFDDRSNVKAIMQGILTQCNDGKVTNKDDEYRTTNSDLGYDRIVSNYFGNENCVNLTYFFKDIHNPNYPFLSHISTIEVLIFKSAFFRFNYLTGPIFEYPMMDGIGELKETYRKEYGRFSPIFNCLSQYDKEVNFEYYISPFIFDKDEFDFRSGDGGMVDMVFIYGDYTIYLHEYTSVSIDEYCLPIVIKDIAHILCQT